MSDLTPDFSGLLEKHGVPLGRRRTSPADITDGFLKEAYRINSHINSLYCYLRSIRVGYLSTTVPSYRTRSVTQKRHYFTDKQRDQIDFESKATLRDLNAGIGQLEQAEQMRKDAEAQVAASKRPRGALKTLGKWAAGGVSQPVVLSLAEELDQGRKNTLNVHRESVLWYLRRKLEEVAEVQRGMMETRLEREVEKSKSVLYKAKGASAITKRPGSAVTGSNGHVRGPSASGGFGGDRGSAMEDAYRSKSEQILSSQQLQIFAQENSEMMKHYEDTLDQIRTAERSVIEISQLQTTLAQNLEMQATRIGTMMEESLNTENDVIRGNKQLKQAAEKWRPAKYVFYVSCGLSAFLIAWDLVI